MFVIDGSKALRKAIRQVFGDDIPVQRCVQHKERNVLDHLPERDRPPIKRSLRQAWSTTTTTRRSSSSGAWQSNSTTTTPAPPTHSEKGMEETLTVTRLRITGKLKRTLQTTNPCESMIATVRAIKRNVKNWSSGEMTMRWTAAGMLEAETRFRKVEGYRGLANLAITIETDLIQRRHKLKRAATTSMCNHQPRDRRHQRFPRRTGQPPGPRRPASAPGSRSRGRAATLADADLAPGPDDLQNCRMSAPTLRARLPHVVRCKDAISSGGVYR